MFFKFFVWEFVIVSFFEFLGKVVGVENGDFIDFFEFFFFYYFEVG